MKKNLILAGFLLASIHTFAQVGINTETPKATFHVKESSPLDITKPEGIIAPQFSGDQLQSKNDAYTTEQTGSIVYVTEAAKTPSGKSIHVTSPGYYYFDGTEWKVIGTGTWKVQGTDNQAFANTQNIYQKGNVAIGFDKASPESDFALSVKGATISQASSELVNSINIKGLAIQEDDTSAIIDFKSSYNGPAIEINSIKELANLTSVLPEKKGYFEILSAIDSPKNSLSAANRQEQYFDATDPNNAVRVYQQLGYAGNASVYTSGVQYRDNSFNNLIMQVYPDADKASLFSLTSFHNKILNSIELSHENGILFQYNNGSYTFPRSSGTANQVLVTNGFTPDNPYINNAQLEWKNISDLVQDKINIKSPNGNCFQITVTDSGSLGTTPINCP
ncbi:hypothetical protein [Chryseobacterium sp. T1]